MGPWKNSAKIEQSGYAPRSGPEIKNGSLISTKDGTLEILRCGLSRGPFGLSRI